MKKKFFFIVIFISFYITQAFSQSRGVTLLEGDKIAGGKVYAVVIGISNYQNIEKLKYADRDASVFADFLKSKAGGSVSPDNIQLLLNENATTGKIDASFGWLADKTKQGDVAIIYFAGHGDVETRTSHQNGFLLSYDSPKNVYIAGALPVSYLSDFVSTLSEKKVQVILITDACRSGKLAGGMDGAKQTSSMLMNQWSSEIKILSCQAGELSQEGKQWGNGRGVFSYYFIQGLSGLADANNDHQVSLSEIYAYLIKNIPEQTKPYDQNPMVLGKMQTVIASVDSLTLADLVKSQNNQTAEILSSLDIRGDEKKEIKNKMDNEVSNKSLSFASVPPPPPPMQDKILIKAVNNVEANFPITISGKTKKSKRIRRKEVSLTSNDKVTKNFEIKNEIIEESDDLQPQYMRKQVADLLENSQHIINEYLQGKLMLLSLEDCKKNAESLKKVGDMMGNKYFLINSIRAKQAFFEGLSLKYFVTNNTDTAQNNKVTACLKKCIMLEPEAAYAYNELGCFYMKTNQYEESIIEFKKAIEMAPQWIFPYTNLGVAYFYQKKYDDAIHYYEKALAIDSSNVQALNNLGYFYSKKKENQKAIACFRKSIIINPQFGVAYFNLSRVSAKQFNIIGFVNNFKKGIKNLHNQKLHYSDIDGLLVFSRVMFKQNSTIMKQ